MISVLGSADSWQTACCFREPFSWPQWRLTDPPCAETRRGHGPSLPGAAGPSSPPGRRALTPGRWLRGEPPTQSFPLILAATQSPPRAWTTIFTTGNDMQEERERVRSN